MGPASKYLEARLQRRPFCSSAAMPDLILELKPNSVAFAYAKQDIHHSCWGSLGTLDYFTIHAVLHTTQNCFSDKYWTNPDSPSKSWLLATKCIVTNSVTFVFLKLWLLPESVSGESHYFTMFFSTFQVCNMEKALRFTVPLNPKQVQVCHSHFLTPWLIRTPAKVDETSPQLRVENPSYSAPLGT